MTHQDHTPHYEVVSVSLVDGDTAVRHARQLLLRSENYDVRSYPTCAALLADPMSRNSSCIVIDIDTRDGDGPAVLRQMRASGWRGRAILLDGADPEGVIAEEAGRHGDQVFGRTIGDRPLLTAIAASVDRGWSSWTAG